MSLIGYNGKKLFDLHRTLVIDPRSYEMHVVYSFQNKSGKFVEDRDIEDSCKIEPNRINKELASKRISAQMVSQSEVPDLGLFDEIEIGDINFSPEQYKRFVKTITTRIHIGESEHQESEERH